MPLTSLNYGSVRRILFNNTILFFLYTTYIIIIIVITTTIIIYDDGRTSYEILLLLCVAIVQQFPEVSNIIQTGVRLLLSPNNVARHLPHRAIRIYYIQYIIL